MNMAQQRQEEEEVDKTRENVHVEAGNEQQIIQTPPASPPQIIPALASPTGRFRANHDPSLLNGQNLQLWDAELPPRIHSQASEDRASQDSQDRVKAKDVAIERIRDAETSHPRQLASSLVQGETKGPPRAILRTASTRSTALRHPTPDLQTLQGAYISNIEILEKTAERLSMTSSIEVAIKDLHSTLKRADSRRSSILLGQEPAAVISRKVSNASSIVEVNSTARSGGFSPSGFMMSPVGSISRSTADRSTPKGSRYGTRPEPELEGRPLDAFVSTSSQLAASITEQDEGALTITKPTVSAEDTRSLSSAEDERPTTSASATTFEQAQREFANFDGVHTLKERYSEVFGQPATDLPPTRAESDMPPSESWRESLAFQDTNLPRAFSFHSQTSQPEADSHLRQTSASPEEAERPILPRPQPVNRHSMARPKSYADPLTGQEMIYYPAPVPAMLKLPPKLSTRPVSMARDKRRSQVMSTLIPPVRDSTLLLPEVLETHGLNETEKQETPSPDRAPQPQRTSGDKRRSRPGLKHISPQLRASAFFELPSRSEPVQIKDHSAVATLDSILDAAAHAPVSAFTDHVIAGHLGAEVYGKEPQARRNSAMLQVHDATAKRKSTVNLVRDASLEVPEKSVEDKRRSTLSGLFDFGKSRTQLVPSGPDVDDGVTAMTPLQSAEAEVESLESDEDDEGQRDDEVYHGPPTTLLAELQIRKQQQKARTRPLTTMYRDGVHSTLLQMDAVAQQEQKTRKGKRVNLAWQEQAPHSDGDEDDDVPLGLLYADKLRNQKANPLGLMEQRELEDNEPLSHRRDRLQGKVPGASRVAVGESLRRRNVAPSPEPEPEIEDETLGQRRRRILAKQQTSSAPLPHTRSVSNDFASELLVQLGAEPEAEAVKSAGIVIDEENETLAQRRDRLKAEAAARAKEVGIAGPQPRPPLRAHRSQADLVRPTASRAVSSNNLTQGNGLIAQHERSQIERSNTMQALTAQARQPSGGQLRRESSMLEGLNGRYAQTSMPTGLGVQYGQQPAQMQMPYQNPGMSGSRLSFVPMSGYAQPAGPMGAPNMNMNMGMNMGMGMNMNMMGMMQPMDPRQLDVVERWRQSVMY